MNVTKINKKYEEMKIREMGELEIRGAQWFLTKCQIEDDEEIYGEVYTTLESVDNETFYCGKHLQYNDYQYVKGHYIGSVFMIEGQSNVLFGLASKNSSFKNDYIVRFDY